MMPASQQNPKMKGLASSVVKKCVPRNGAVSSLRDALPCPLLGSEPLACIHVQNRFAQDIPKQSLWIHEHDIIEEASSMTD